jgi:hypothetical protein
MRTTPKTNTDTVVPVKFGGGEPALIQGSNSVPAIQENKITNSTSEPKTTIRETCDMTGGIASSFTFDPSRLCNASRAALVLLTLMSVE